MTFFILFFRFFLASSDWTDWLKNEYQEDTAGFIKGQQNHTLLLTFFHFSKSFLYVLLTIFVAKMLCTQKHFGLHSHVLYITTFLINFYLYEQVGCVGSSTRVGRDGTCKNPCQWWKNGNLINEGKNIREPFFNQGSLA